MTEAEWLACTDPQPMLEFLRGKASDRKLRLFACACCRRLLGLFPNAVIRQVVEFSEKDADQLAGLDGLIQAKQAMDSWRGTRGTKGRVFEDTHAEASAVRTAHFLIQRRPMLCEMLAKYVARDAATAVSRAANDRRAILEAPAAEVVQVARATWQAAQVAFATELRTQANLLRDIVGTPFCSVAIDPMWLRPEVVVFAEIIYERQTFERLAALAKVLEEVGCSDRSLLDHCRQPGVHVRGCWVVDLLLGKT